MPPRRRCYGARCTTYRRRTGGSYRRRRCVRTRRRRVRTGGFLTNLLGKGLRAVGGLLSG